MLKPFKPATVLRSEVDNVSVAIETLHPPHLLARIAKRSGDIASKSRFRHQVDLASLEEILDVRTPVPIGCYDCIGRLQMECYATGERQIEVRIGSPRPDRHDQIRQQNGAD